MCRGGGRGWWGWGGWGVVGEGERSLVPVPYVQGNSDLGTRLQNDMFESRHYKDTQDATQNALSDCWLN